MDPHSPVICSVTYRVDQAKLPEFERYARAWVTLINRYGGYHEGYFAAVPGQTAHISFPELGRDGPADIVIARFRFPSVEAYQSYRRAVREDSLCAAAEAILQETGCVLRYERTFLRLLVSGDAALDE